jgi:hypothetical protein
MLSCDESVQLCKSKRIVTEADDENSIWGKLTTYNPRLEIMVMIKI